MSDIDIAVVPEDSEINKLRLICELDCIFVGSVDLTVITPHTDPLLEFEIFSKGKFSSEKRDGLFEEYKLKAWKKYLDTEKIRKLRGEFIRAYIKELRNVTRSGKTEA